MISADDLRNFYHLITGSRERAASTPVGPPYPARLFRGWKAHNEEWPDELQLHLCWPGLGMGDLNAVDIAQELHMHMVRSTLLQVTGDRQIA